MVKGKRGRLIVTVKGSQVMPCHRHGLVAEESQLENAFFGLKNYRFASRRKRVSWVREKVCVGEEELRLARQCCALRKKTCLA